jgi:hypothetical protein
VKKRQRDLVVVNPPLNWPNRWFGFSVVVGVGRFSHRVVTAGEIISAILMGQISTGAYMKCLLNATSGNIVGGVVILSLDIIQGKFISEKTNIAAGNSSAASWQTEDRQFAISF